jgi:hypothetical protein
MTQNTPYFVLFGNVYQWETGTSSGTYGQSERLRNPEVEIKNGRRSRRGRFECAPTHPCSVRSQCGRTDPMRSLSCNTLVHGIHGVGRLCGSDSSRLWCVPIPSSDRFVTYPLLRRRLHPVVSTTTIALFYQVSPHASVPKRCVDKHSRKEQRDSATPYQLQFRSPFPRVARDRW